MANVVRKGSHRSLLNSWIDEAIAEVGDQVYDDDQEAIDHHHALQHGVVALGQGADDHLAEAWPVENDFGEHRIADEDADIEADHGYRRNQGIGETVAPDDGAPRHAFGACGADVVLSQNL